MSEVKLNMAYATIRKMESELAALRLQCGGMQMDLDERGIELAALREELAQLRRWEQMISENLRTMQRLTATEQRNAVLVEALTEERRIRLLGQQPDTHWESLRDCRRSCYAKTDAALKPTESGASE